MKKILHVCASVVNVAFFRAAAAIFWGQTTWDWCKIVFCSTVKGLFIKVKSPVTHPPQVLNRKKKEVINIPGRRWCISKCYAVRTLPPERETDPPSLSCTSGLVTCTWGQELRDSTSNPTHPSRSRGSSSPSVPRNERDAVPRDTAPKRRKG